MILLDSKRIESKVSPTLNKGVRIAKFNNEKLPFLTTVYKEKMTGKFQDMTVSRKYESHFSKG